MRVVRVDEINYQRRQWGAFEQYLNDRKNGKARRDFIKSLREDEVLALVSINGKNVLYVRGFTEFEEGGAIRWCLGFYQMQIADGKWSLPMLQHFAQVNRLPFTVTNYKPFEEYFPKAAAAKKAFVRKRA